MQSSQENMNVPWLTRLLFSFLLVLHISRNALGYTEQQETLYQCRGIRNKRNSRISYPPNITGSWFSSSCELLPGPQYVLRHYQFTKDGKFSITRYYYSDQICTLPSYSIHSQGTIAAQSASWVLSEGTDMDFNHTAMSVHPYTSEAASMLGPMLSNNCGLPNIWNNNSVVGYTSLPIDTTDEMCLETLLFSINELLVMRQVNYGKVGAAHHVERELQLGSVWFSQWQRPSSYQDPLYSPMHKHCAACQCIYAASVENPPSRCHHSNTRPEMGNLHGSWFSQQCESVPNGLFTLREYNFNQTETEFVIKTHYFTDAFCSQPSFTLEAVGSYLPLNEHPRLWNTRSYKLHTRKIKAILRSEAMVETVNLGESSKCGNIMSWIRGVQYDISSTSGCDALGLDVRSEEFVLVKIERHSHAEYLQMSEPKSQEEDFNSQITFFQHTLKRCSAVPHRWFQFSVGTSYTDSSVSFKYYPVTILFGVIISWLH